MQKNSNYQNNFEKEIEFENLQCLIQGLFLSCVINTVCYWCKDVQICQKIRRENSKKMICFMANKFSKAQIQFSRGKIVYFANGVEPSEYPLTTKKEFKPIFHITYKI